MVDKFTVKAHNGNGEIVVPGLITVNLKAHIQARAEAPIKVCKYASVCLGPVYTARRNHVMSDT